MTDIGFGLIDKRTVLVVLFSMVLAKLLMNFVIPLDSTNALNLFVGLVLLTGYIYLARSLYRLPVAFIASIVMAYFYGHSSAQIAKDNLKTLQNSFSDNENQFQRRIKKIWLIVNLYIGIPIGTLIIVPLGILSFGEWIEEWRDRLEEFEEHQGPYNSRSPLRSIELILGTLDRIGLVIISVFATIPSFYPIIAKIGIFGLLIMLILFLFRGDFTGLVRDLIEKSKTENKEEKKPFFFRWL